MWKWWFSSLWIGPERKQSLLWRKDPSVSTSSGFIVPGHRDCDSHSWVSCLSSWGKLLEDPCRGFLGDRGGWLGSQTGLGPWAKSKDIFFLGVSGESKPTHAQIPPGSQSVGGFPISRYRVSSPLYRGQFCLRVDTGSGLPTPGGTLRRCYQVFTCILSTGCVSFQDRGWHVDSPRMWAGC